MRPISNEGEAFWRAVFSRSAEWAKWWDLGLDGETHWNRAWSLAVMNLIFLIQEVGVDILPYLLLLVFVRELHSVFGQQILAWSARMMSISYRAIHNNHQWIYIHKVTFPLFSFLSEQNTVDSPLWQKQTLLYMPSFPNIANTLMN